MRREIKDRYYRTFTYQQVDRVPDLEFGYWPQTIRRWLKEGLPLKLTSSETNDSFSPVLDSFFGFEYERHALRLPVPMIPEYAEKVLETKAGSVVVLGADGVVSERYTADSEDSSIPHYIKFPVENPADWKELRKRYRLDDPARAVPADRVAEARKAVAEGRSVRAFFTGFYGQLRNWMGVENVSYAFYDYPDMIRDMVELWTELLVGQIEQLPADLPVDQIDWWEDMASKSGPLISPDAFEEFLKPGYHRVMEAARKHQCAYGLVDCDGNPHDLIRHWLDEGVSVMFPLEFTAGVDPYAWRKEFGKEIRLRGGVAKDPLVAGGAAIDRELERLRPLLEDGGYIPHLDHLVPPNVSYRNYCEYLEKKRKFIGKTG